LLWIFLITYHTGGLVVCNFSDQAKMLFEIFESKYAQKKHIIQTSLWLEPSESYGNKRSPKEKRCGNPA
jgi:type I restriction enzyme R subunit